MAKILLISDGRVGISRTLKAPCRFSGKSLFTNLFVDIECIPQRDRPGIFFQRTDLEGSPEILANLSNVVSTERRVTLKEGEAHVGLVEHLLSALAACGIDRLLIRINGPEVPILDGSALPFIDCFFQTGFEEIPMVQEPIEIQEPHVFSMGESTIIATPSKRTVYSYVLSYPGHPLLDWMSYIFPFSEEGYRKEIAPARTFAQLEEIEVLRKMNGLLGGSFDNVVVLDQNRVLNVEGLRFSDEMVRHKILDFIGDISLLGVSLIGHFTIICGGHTSHIGFAKKIEETLLLEV